MNGNNNHTALIPSEDITKEAGNRVSPKSARKGEPLLHMTDDMRRLSTPWAISMVRAQQIESFEQNQIQLAKELEEKYGKGTVNLESGEFVKT